MCTSHLFIQHVRSYTRVEQIGSIFCYQLFDSNKQAKRVLSRETPMMTFSILLSETNERACACACMCLCLTMCDYFSIEMSVICVHYEKSNHVDFDT